MGPEVHNYFKCNLPSKGKGEWKGRQDKQMWRESNGGHAHWRWTWLMANNLQPPWPFNYLLKGTGQGQWLASESPGNRTEPKSSPLIVKKCTNTQVQQASPATILSKLWHLSPFRIRVLSLLNALPPPPAKIRRQLSRHFPTEILFVKERLSTQMKTINKIK